MISDPDQRLSDCLCQWNHVLQGEERHPRRGQRGRLQRVRQAVGRHHPEERAGDNDSGRDIVSPRKHCQGDEGLMIIMIMTIILK